MSSREEAKIDMALLVWPFSTMTLLVSYKDLSTPFAAFTYPFYAIVTKILSRIADRWKSGPKVDDLPSPQNVSPFAVQRYEETRCGNQNPTGENDEVRMEILQSEDASSVRLLCSPIRVTQGIIEVFLEKPRRYDPQQSEEWY